MKLNSFSYLNDYIPIFFFIIVGLIFILVLVKVSYTVSPSSLEIDKFSVYECGFEPFSGYGGFNNINFFIIAILFLIFELEVVFLYPWVVSLQYNSIFGKYSAYLFIVLLIVGFFYEWKRGVLDWYANNNINNEF